MSFNIDWVMAGAVIITGMVVVFVTLILLWWIMILMGKVMNSITGGGGSKAGQAPAPKNKPAANNQPALAVGQAVQQDGISGDIVAAITAAIAAMTGSSGFVVKSIRRAAQARSAWTMAGLGQNVQSF